VHVTGFVPVHAPDWQLSLCVHALPSLQLAPSLFAGLLHAPVDGLHVPTVWHWSLAKQLTGAEPRHTPERHESASVQALPSLHGVSFGFGLGTQVPLTVSQAGVWHEVTGRSAQ